jgi:methionine synthase I (cobalamin-dependent)
MLLPEPIEPALGRRTVLFDGALGTALIAQGLDLSVEPPEAWLTRHPERLVATHRGFVEAGAEVIQTGSFGLLRLLRAGQVPGAGADPLVRAVQQAGQSVALSARAIADAAAASAAMGTSDPLPGGPARRWIVASLGPSGPPPRAEDLSGIAASTEALARAFSEAGAAALHIETACDPGDLAAMLEGAGRTALPIFASVTLSLGQSGLETPLGVPLSRMLKVIESAPVRPIVVGVNCSQPARRLRRAVSELADWAHGQRGVRPQIVAQPQVDEPAPDCKRPPQPETPERFARDLLQLLQDGADHLGGCCGCRPEHIAAVAALLRADRH